MLSNGNYINDWYTKFDHMYEFIDGLAIVCKNEKWGFVDITGKEIIPCIYDDIRPFYENFTRVKIEEKWELVNKFGKIETSCNYDLIGGFVDGKAIIVKDSKMGMISSKGREIIPCQYEEIYFLNENGIKEYKSQGINLSTENIICAKKNGKYGYIDFEGNEIIPFIYDMAGNFIDGVALVSDTEGLGGINKLGKKVSAFQKYESIEKTRNGYIKVQNGYVRVKKDGKWGFINKSGDVSVPIIYDFTWPFVEASGYIPVNKDGKYGCVDTNGNIIVPIIYDKEIGIFNGQVRILDENCVFKPLDDDKTSKPINMHNKKKIKVIKDGKYEIVYEDEVGEDSKPFTYHRGFCFSEGLSSVQESDPMEIEDSKWGFLDENGNEAIPFIYEMAGNFINGIAPVQKDRKVGYINKQGQTVIPFIYDSFSEYYRD